MSKAYWKRKWTELYDEVDKSDQLDAKRKDAVFYQGPNFCTKFDPLNDFFKRRTSYHFKAKEFTKNLKICTFIDIS